MILHLSHIFLTEGRTFIDDPFSCELLLLSMTPQPLALSWNWVVAGLYWFAVVNVGWLKACAHLQSVLTCSLCSL